MTGGGRGPKKTNLAIRWKRRPEKQEWVGVASVKQQSGWCKNRSGIPANLVCYKTAVLPPRNKKLIAKAILVRMYFIDLIYSEKERLRK